MSKFNDWFNKFSEYDDDSYLYASECGSAWFACKEEVLKIIKSKYPCYVHDKVYENGFDAACSTIEDEIKELL